MKDSLPESPNYFILIADKNELNMKNSEIIKNSIFDIATRLKADSQDIRVSNMITRADNVRLSEKGC